MTKENVKLFYEALTRDKNLQLKFSAISQKFQEQKLTRAEQDLRMNKELVLLAAEAGYPFTVTDLGGYARDAEKPALQELSEDELAAVSGGTCDACTGSYCPDIPGAQVHCPDSGLT